MVSSRPKKSRSLKRRIKQAVFRPFKRILFIVGPWAYYGYISLVWMTSRVEYIGVPEMIKLRKENTGIVATLWHETVFFVAYAFRELHGSALASKGGMGEFVARMLKLCRFEVFRGGSSQGRKRRDVGVLVAMIKHMNLFENIMYGLTVDGSKGPAYSFKKGAVFIAKETETPLIPVHVAAKPSFRMRTWDRTIVPIPFGHIVVHFGGAYRCPKNATKKEIEECREMMERVLNEHRIATNHYLNTGELQAPSIPPDEPIQSEIRKGRHLLRRDEIIQPVTRRPGPV